MSQSEADSERMRQALARFDEANREDPRRVRVDGFELPQELVYGRRMSDCLSSFSPDASEPLRLAVRAQHLCRWRLARDEYAPGRAGYLEWRRDCGRMHADLAAETLTLVGYEPSVVERVGSLIRKEGLGSDEEAQSLEDVACLVFLESYSEAFVAEHDQATCRRVFRKTWRKMSPAARRVAAQVELAPAVESLLQELVAALPASTVAQEVSK